MVLFQFKLPGSYPVNVATAPTANQVLAWNSVTLLWEAQTLGLSQLPTYPTNQWDWIRTGGVSWYGSAVDCQISNTSALVANVLRAYPFIVRRGFATDRIQFEVTIQAVGFAVVGIYDNTPNTLYPRNLLVQGTQQDTNVLGAHTDTIAFTLPSDSLLWIVYNANATPTVRSFSGNATIPMVLGDTGVAAANNENFGWTVASIYNATLPAAFVAGGTVLTGSATVPKIMVRAT